MKRRNNTAIKRNASSTHVLKTLQVLLQGNYTMAELIEKLNNDEKEPVFNNSVVSKYINTCKYCGIKITKIRNKYQVVSIPFGMNLTSREYELIQNLELIAKKIFSKKTFKMFEKIIKNINMYSNKEILKISENTTESLADKFEDAVKDGLKVKLMLKSGEDIICIPIKTKLGNQKLFYEIIFNGKKQLIQNDSLTGLEILNEKVCGFNKERTVVYKLYGGLAKRYRLRENESVLPDSSSNHITISNSRDDKDLLVSRLLRYDSLCEVLKPAEYRDEMIKTINDTLANYGEV